MIARGRVNNGIVLLEDGRSLPEGAPVIVWPDTSWPPTAAGTGEDTDRACEEEHRRLLEAIDRIAALPLEGPQEPFSGADHDKVLYGAP
jgi:hypothetical protein